MPGVPGAGLRGSRVDAPATPLPLLLPVVIGTAKLLAPTFAAGGASALPTRWLTIVGLYDLVFGLIALAVFDFLLED